MKLWLLKRRDDLQGDHPWVPWYDTMDSIVVRAETEVRARQIAQENGGYETEHSKREMGAWLEDRWSTCTELTAQGPEEVIIEDVQDA